MAERFDAYSSSNLAGDISGAASSAVVNILQALGYGLIAFAILGPEYIGIGASLGLLSAITGCLVASVAGGTGIIISGPVFSLPTRTSPWRARDPRNLNFQRATDGESCG